MGMTILQLPKSIQGIVVDLDRTLYPRSEGDPYLADSAERSMPFLGERLGMSIEDAELLAEVKRQEWIAQEGRRPVFAELLDSLGIDPLSWYPIRARCCHPEKFISPNPNLRKVLIRTRAMVRVAILTNAPQVVAHRVLHCIGVADLGFPVCSPDAFRSFKPQQQAFHAAATALELEGEHLVAIGDRLATDCEAALAAGYGGAVHVKGPEDVIAFIRTVLFTR